MTGEPVNPIIKQLEELAQQYMEGKVISSLDFSDTKTAFAYKTDKELKHSLWLFNMMNRPMLVKLATTAALLAIKLRMPFVIAALKGTIFKQFCAGTTLLESQKVIELLEAHNVYSILDYGVEAKENEDDFNHTMNETIRSLEFASRNTAVPVVSAKITGLGRFGLFEKIQNQLNLNKEEQQEWSNVKKRLDSICHVAAQQGVSLFFDAEESWIQNTLDHLVTKMMRRYNKEKAIVYNTFQMYRKDRLQFLIHSFNDAEERGYFLGAKLVRGAYMEKERDRAAKMGYASPINPNRKATNDSFNMAVRFCIDNYEKIASCNASHNEFSNKLQVRLMEDKDIPKDHPHLMFSQLYGMSDNLTFNLARAGYHVSKYIPYGPVKEVVPYLIRRAEENTAVTGDMSREYQLIKKEVNRRGI